MAWEGKDALSPLSRYFQYLHSFYKIIKKGAAESGAENQMFFRPMDVKISKDLGKDVFCPLLVSTAGRHSWPFVPVLATIAYGTWNAEKKVEKQGVQAKTWSHPLLSPVSTRGEERSWKISPLPLELPQIPLILYFRCFVVIISGWSSSKLYSSPHLCSPGSLGFICLTWPLHQVQASKVVSINMTMPGWSQTHQAPTLQKLTKWTIWFLYIESMRREADLHFH